MSGFFVCEFNPGGEGEALVPKPRFLINENYNVMNKLITTVMVENEKYQMTYSDLLEKKKHYCKI